MYFDGFGTDSSRGAYNFFWVHHTTSIKKFPEMFQKSRFASMASFCSFAVSGPSSFFPRGRTSTDIFNQIRMRSTRVGGLTIWTFFCQFNWTVSTGECEVFSGFFESHFFFFESSDVDFWSSVVSQFFCICHEQISCPAAHRVQGISDKIILRILELNWWSLSFLSVDIGWWTTSDPKGIVGPRNGVSYLLSWGVFPSAINSCKFRE